MKTKVFVIVSGVESECDSSAWTRTLNRARKSPSWTIFRRRTSRALKWVLHPFCAIRYLLNSIESGPWVTFDLIMMQSNGSDGRYLPPAAPAGMDYSTMEAVHHHHPAHHPGLVDPHLHYGLAPPHPHHHQGLHGLGQPPPPPQALAGGVGVKRSADSAGLEMMGASDSDEDSMVDVKPSISDRGRGASGKNAGDSVAASKKTRGRVKIKMEFIDNKLRRYTTFSKRKTGIMKKVS